MILLKFEGVQIKKKKKADTDFNCNFCFATEFPQQLPAFHGSK